MLEAEVLSFAGNIRRFLTGGKDLDVRVFLLQLGGSAGMVVVLMGQHQLREPSGVKSMGLELRFNHGQRAWIAAVYEDGAALTEKNSGVYVLFHTAECVFQIEYFISRVHTAPRSSI